MSPKRVNLIVNVTTDDANHKFTVNEENSMAFQKYEVHYLTNFFFFLFQAVYKNFG